MSTSIGGEIMNYIQFGVVILALLLVFTVIIDIWMKVANKVGEKLRIGNFFLNLCKKICRDNK